MKTNCIKTVAVLSARVKRLERELAAMTRRRENWEKCAMATGETLRQFGAIIDGCIKCQRKRKRLYHAKARRAAERA